MKKLRFKLSDSHTYEIGMPELGAQRKRGLLLKAVYFLGLWSMAVAVVSLPFVYHWHATPITEVPVLFMTFVFILLAALAIGVTLGGWGFLVDPPALVQVLVFSLLVVSAYLFVPLPSPLPARYAGTNTFGVGLVRYLGGLYVMGFVALFYLIQIFVAKTAHYIRLTQAMVFSMVMVVLLIVSREALVKDLGQVALVAVPFLLAFVLYGTGRWLALVAIPALAFAVLVVLTYLTDIWTLLVILLTLVAMVLTWLRARNWELPSMWSQLKKGFDKYLNTSSSIIEVVQESSFPLLLIALLAWFAFVVGWLLTTHSNIGQQLQAFVNVYSLSFNRLDEPVRLLLGRGATADPVTTTLATVIIYQGLAGLLAYGVLTVTSLYVAFKAMASDIRSNAKIGLWSFVLSPILMVVPLIAITDILTFPVVIMWWLAFGLLAVRLHLLQRKQIKDIVGEIKVWRYSIKQRLPWVQLALVLLILAFIWYFIPILRTQLT